MQVILPIIYTLLFIWIIFKWNFFDIPQLSRKKIALLFVIKIAAGIIVWLADTYYFNFSDALHYYQKAGILHDSFFIDPTATLKFIVGINDSSTVELSKAISGWNASFETTLFNDARTMLRINFILHFISFGSYHVHMLIFCFASFVGLTAIYKSLQGFFINKHNWLIIALFFIPTVLYWSSGVLKEAVLTMGIGLLLFSTQWGTVFLKGNKNLLMLLLSLLFLISIKRYVLLILLIPLSANYIYFVFKPKKIVVSYVIISSIAIVLLFAVAKINPNYSILRIISDKQAKAVSEAIGGYFIGNDKKFICISYNDYNQLDLVGFETYKIKPGSLYLEWEQNNMSDTTYITNSTDTSIYKLFYMQIPSNSRLEMPKMNANIVSFIKNIPFALYHTLMRPCIIKPKNLFEYFALIESCIVLVFILLSIIFYQKPNIEQKKIIAFCFFTSLSLLILIGLTTPTLGSMVRYKLPALLFMAIAIFLLIDFEKIQALFKSK